MKVKKENLPRGILLDIGCRNRKEPNWIGMDWRSHPGVDIVHDLASFPYPIEDNACLTIKCAHVIEHIPPQKTLAFMDELWRMLMPNGQLAISAPYAGSPGFYQDPTHCTPITERTWQHFDPQYPLFEQYTPKPWRMDYSAYKPDGNIEAIMRKIIPQDMTDSLTVANKAVYEYGAMQKPTELMLFLETLRGKSLKTVVEIGTANGGVLWALCRTADDDAHLISIDLPGGEFGGGYNPEMVKKFKKFAKKGQKMDFLMVNSHLDSTKKDLAKLLNGNKADLLFIDGDHSYKGVKKDWEMYSPLVKKGGLVVFHDIVLHLQFPLCEVQRFWNQLKKKRQVLEYVDMNDTSWGGIGVVTI